MLAKIQSEHQKEGKAWSDFECGMVVGSRPAGLTILLLRFEWTSAWAQKEFHPAGWSLQCIYRSQLTWEKGSCHPAMYTACWLETVAGIIVEPFTAQGQKHGTLREGTLGVMNWGCSALSWKGGWRVTLQVDLKEERVHNVAPAAISWTPLYDAHRDKRDAGLPLHFLMFCTSAAKGWPWVNQLCSSGDNRVRRCITVCEGRLLSCEKKNTVHQPILRIAYAEARPLVCCCVLLLYSRITKSKV